MKREVFEPLNLTEAGFGPPKSGDGTLEQPRGHRPRLAGKLAVDDRADNTPIMAPSAGIHMSLGDLCIFANEHLRGDRGEGKLLSAETYHLLHTPDLNNYCYGWIRRDTDATIPNTAYWSNGTNTMWSAFVTFVQKQTWWWPSPRTTATSSRLKPRPGKSSRQPSNGWMPKRLAKVTEPGRMKLAGGGFHLRGHDGEGHKRRLA